jgi:hypothetical protein
VQEAWPGSAVPLPAALIDCAGSLAVCGGEAGCPLPPSRVDGGAAAAVARPRERVAALRLSLLVQTREVLRAAHSRCLEGGCGPVDEDFWRAAATAVRLRIEGPGHDAGVLEPDQVARLVSGLLTLTGGESGPGETPWWDGTLRPVPDRAVLVAALESLALPAGHVPDLDGHPYPAVLSGAAEWADSEGLCGRLPGLLDAATASGGAPPAAPVTVWDAERVLPEGARVTGEGLLVIRGPVRIAGTARIEWTGSVVLAGGGVAGPGSVAVSGSVVILPPTLPGAVDLSGAGWLIAADPEAHRRAWAAAGIVAASSWWPLEGE